jgi:ATP/maltotriose-dependent transcriptional regulator MalT
MPEELGRCTRAQRQRNAPGGTALVKDGELGRLEVQFVPRRSPGESDALLLTLRPRERLPEAGLRALGLTQREAQLLRLVAGGMSDAAIAGELCIATDTVKKHLQRIYRKLEVHSRTAAVAKLLEAV